MPAAVLHYVLEGAAKDDAAEKNPQPVFVTKPIEPNGDNQCSHAIDGVKGAVDESNAIGYAVKSEKIPDIFKHHAGNAANRKDPKKLIK